MKQTALCCAVLVGAVWAPGRAQADDVHPLSVAQAIERAVTGNPDLRRERVAVAQAAGRKLGAEGKFDVVLDGQLQTVRDLTPALCVAELCKDASAGKTTTTVFGLGLSRTLETGGNLRLGGQASRVQSVVPASSDAYAGTFYATSLALTFTQPLLRGLGVEIAEANLRKARINQDIALLGRQTRACNVLRDVVIAYWELAYSTQDLAIRRSALALAHEQLRITQAMIAAGRLADADAASVERAIAQRQEEMVAAEQSLFFRNLDLWRLFGVSAQAGQATLAAADVPASAAVPIDEAGALARALESNPQLRALRLGQSLSQLDIATARNTLRPRLDFTGSVGPVGRKPGLGDSLRNAARLDEWTWSAGLAFELPVQNRTARGQMREAEEERNLASINAEDFALQVRDLVLRAARSIHTASRRVELGNREVEFAEKNLDAEHARFQAGRATNNDVLLRQQELKDAETRLLRATIDQSESEATLTAVTAEILDLYGITLQGAEP
jgi:outer membrane protein